MEVLIEQKVMEDRVINKQPAFSSICNKLSTFTEGIFYKSVIEFVY